jgi:hypothetical protein
LQDQEGELLQQHVKKMKLLINERLEDLENKRDNLLDIKIKDLVEVWFFTLAHFFCLLLGISRMDGRN